MYSIYIMIIKTTHHDITLANFESVEFKEGLVLLLCTQNEDNLRVELTDVHANCTFGYVTDIDAISDSSHIVDELARSSVATTEQYQAMEKPIAEYISRWITQIN